MINTQSETPALLRTNSRNLGVPGFRNQGALIGAPVPRFILSQFHAALLRLGPCSFGASRSHPASIRKVTCVYRRRTAWLTETHLCQRYCYAKYLSKPNWVLRNQQSKKSCGVQQRSFQSVWINQADDERDRADRSIGNEGLLAGSSRLRR
jgi:hypothetical protein